MAKTIMTDPPCAYRCTVTHVFRVREKEGLRQIHSRWAVHTRNHWHSYCKMPPLETTPNHTTLFWRLRTIAVPKRGRHVPDAAWVVKAQRGAPGRFESRRLAARKRPVAKQEYISACRGHSDPPPPQTVSKTSRQRGAARGQLCSTGTLSTAERETKHFSYIGLEHRQLKQQEVTEMAAHNHALIEILYLCTLCHLLANWFYTRLQRMAATKSFRACAKSAESYRFVITLTNVILENSAAVIVKGYTTMEPTIFCTTEQRLVTDGHTDLQTTSWSDAPMTKDATRSITLSFIGGVVPLILLNACKTLLYWTFMSLHGISKKRMQYLQKSLKTTGMVPKDRRGKYDHKHCSIPDEVTESVVSHISSFKGRQNKEKHKIETQMRTAQVTNEVHKRKAKVFYERKRTARQRRMKNESHKAITFDFQKNVPMPNLTTNDVYYRWQLSLYSFNIHTLSTGHNEFYCYPEPEGRKGSHENMALINQKYPAELPEHWVEVFENARTKPSPYHVVNVDQARLRNWTQYLTSLYTKTCPIATRPLTEVVFSVQHPHLIKHRSTYNGKWETAVMVPQKSLLTQVKELQLHSGEFLLPEKRYQGSGELRLIYEVFIERHDTSDTTIKTEQSAKIQDAYDVSTTKTVAARPEVLDMINYLYICHAVQHDKISRARRSYVTPALMKHKISRGISELFQNSPECSARDNNVQYSSDVHTGGNVKKKHRVVAMVEIRDKVTSTVDTIGSVKETSAALSRQA
ncbi:hypothetical protein PR048_005728 [Dryococelus australis]|uniref:Uncharacterized protein n=1 Tax=Dryococelus australis TaxID=614101 RepID=A0ABQ9I8Z2_9NEOP|nr:hypothetical protein PR048_005728 [Dryococelus australis]